MTNRFSQDMSVVEIELSLAWLDFAVLPSAMLTNSILWCIFCGRFVAIVAFVRSFLLLSTEIPLQNFPLGPGSGLEIQIIALHIVSRPGLGAGQKGAAGMPRAFRRAVSPTSQRVPAPVLLIAWRQAVARYGP